MTSDALISGFLIVMTKVRRKRVVEACVKGDLIAHFTLLYFILFIYLFWWYCDLNSGPPAYYPGHSPTSSPY
jgi:hypothetical protein